ncbi:hypothetical protein [Pseudoduganella sp. R-43]|uniref:hypothetical protein n=1 Tax=unclassified Pseudoduganella TaxID=2637179 RepID=UPI003CEC2AC0
MDIEERMAKAETEIAILKEMQNELRAAMALGFAEQRQVMEAGFAEQRRVMEAGFAEQRQALDAGLREVREARERAIAELRQEMQRGFRWTFSALLSILALVLGIIARLAGAI